MAMTTSIKTLRFEIGAIAGDGPGRRKRWYELAQASQIAFNVFWRTWEQWHHAHGSPKLIRDDLDRYRRWTETKEGPRPKDRVKPIGSALGKTIYRAIADGLRDLHIASSGVVQRTASQGVTKRRSTHGNLPGWKAILLDLDRRPTACEPHPVPIHPTNFTLIPPKDKDSNFKVRFTIERIDRGERNATSVTDECEILTRRVKMRSQAAWLWKILGGEASRAGAKIQWDAKKRKWFLMLGVRYEAEARPNLDPAKRAVLHPAIRHPWTVFIDGRKQWLGGRGRYVAITRQRMLTGRWSRQEKYRWAGGSTKGHGRQRVMLPLEQLQQTWRFFVTRLNRNIVAELVTRCVERGIGTIEYVQPDGPIRDNRFLWRAGKVAGRDDATGWDWFQVATFLRQKCQPLGIEVVVRKSSGARKPEQGEAA